MPSMQENAGTIPNKGLRMHVRKRTGLRAGKTAEMKGAVPVVARQDDYNGEYR